MLAPRLQMKYDRQAEMLANRVKKRYQHFHKRFTKQKIDVFRLYEGDIPGWKILDVRSLFTANRHISPHRRAGCDR